MPDPDPIVVLTRPRDDSEAFAQDLGWPCVISPVLRVDDLGDVGAIPADGGLILTSRHAASRLPPGSARAYCVGKATAAVARAKGYETLVGGGDAEALLRRILLDQPKGHWLHLRGEKSRGNLCARLNTEGITCAERIIYRTVPQPLSEEARAAIQSGRGVVMPLFSPYSARVVMEDMPRFARVTFVVMSGAVADEIGTTGAQKVIIAAQPTRTALLDAVKEVLGSAA